MRDWNNGSASHARFPTTVIYGRENCFLRSSRAADVWLWQTADDKSNKPVGAVSIMLLPDILLPKATCKRFSSFGWQIKIDENVWYCIWLIPQSVSTIKKGFAQYLHQCIKRCSTVSLLLHRRRNYCFTTWQTASSQANEHPSPISETAALTSSQLKLKHMKVFVLLFRRYTNIHPWMQNLLVFSICIRTLHVCLYHSVLVVCLFVCCGGSPFSVTSFCTSSFPSLLHSWPDFSIVFIPGV